MTRQATSAPFPSDRTRPGTESPRRFGQRRGMPSCAGGTATPPVGLEFHPTETYWSHAAARATLKTPRVSMTLAMNCPRPDPDRRPSCYESEGRLFESAWAHPMKSRIYTGNQEVTAQQFAHVRTGS